MRKPWSDCACVSVETESDVMAMANDSEYGLAAYFYAKDMARIMRVAKHIETGMVAVNSGLSTELAPFGGIKQSGMGREGSFMGLDDYVEAKYVHWPELMMGVKTSFRVRLVLISSIDRPVAGG